MYCDECGTCIEKAHRVHRALRYCTACYARVFKKRACPKCSNFVRLPNNDVTAICRQCEENKPCIRCGKVSYKVGKISQYGPVCNSCVPYYREQKVCGLCNKLSPRLSRVKRLNIDIQICQKCARHDYGTCHLCGRNRLLLTNSDGILVCKLCWGGEAVSCQFCGEKMPAGKGKQCDKCYWANSLRSRIRLDQSAFFFADNG